MSVRNHGVWLNSASYNFKCRRRWAWEYRSVLRASVLSFVARPRRRIALSCDFWNVFQPRRIINNWPLEPQVGGSHTQMIRTRLFLLFLAFLKAKRAFTLLSEWRGNAKIKAFDHFRFGRPYPNRNEREDFASIQKGKTFYRKHLIPHLGFEACLSPAHHSDLFLIVEASTLGWLIRHIGKDGFRRTAKHLRIRQSQ